jgi:hypothetical protein
MSAHSRAARKRCTGALLLITLQGAACQAWHAEAGAPPAVLATYQPTKLRVTRTDGRQVVLQHPAVRGDTLVGIAHNQNEQQEVRIALTDVRQVATRGFSAGRTVALGVGVLGVAAILLAAGACGADGGHMTVSGCVGAN